MRITHFTDNRSGLIVDKSAFQDRQLITEHKDLLHCCTAASENIDTKYILALLKFNTQAKLKLIFEMSKPENKRKVQTVSITVLK